MRMTIADNYDYDVDDDDNDDGKQKRIDRQTHHEECKNAGLHDQNSPASKCLFGVVYTSI